jgi:hypothetical protein
MYKIIGADGKEYGPISIEQLKQWSIEGRVNALTQVAREGTTDWRAFSTYPELAGPPPLPSGPMPGTISGAPQYGPGYSNAAMDAVNGPAVGLIVFAVLGLLMQAGALLFSLAGTAFLASSTSNMPNNAMWINALTGTMGMVLHVLSIVIGVVILVGGIKMKKLENHGFAMTASILAMIPCVSPCCLIGLPIGIWAVVVLSKPEVKASFH